MSANSRAHHRGGARRLASRRNSPPPSSPTRISPRWRRRARSTPMCWRRPERARAMAQGGSTRGIAKGEARPARRHSARHQGPVLRPRRCAHHRLLAHPRQFRAALRVDRRPRSSGATARCCSARLNNDEFAMGSSNETSFFGHGHVAVAARGREHAARAGRLVRRLGRGGRGASLPGRDRAPTPAARSASRRRSPASSASSRPTAAARAGASSRSRPRSIRPGRSRARCATPRS